MQRLGMTTKTRNEALAMRQLNHCLDTAVYKMILGQCRTDFLIWLQIHQGCQRLKKEHSLAIQGEGPYNITIIYVRAR